MKLTLGDLIAAVAGNAAALRCRRRLQPAGGEGDKVFPPTYAGGVYAVEMRRLAGHPEPVTCVLLDSVQSQANRMELALHDAQAELKLPVVVVDFSEADPTLPEKIGRLTSLQVPHRLSDAILRDSNLDGQKFRDSEIGHQVNAMSSNNATPVFEFCPTALVFGMWDSTGPKGGLGAKFERALVSEVIGINASFGVRTASRIDPIVTTTADIKVYQAMGGGWTLDQAKAVVKDGKPLLVGKSEKAGKASAVNLGNVTPSFTKYGKDPQGLDPLRSGKVSINYTIRSNEDEFSIRNQAAAEARPAQQGQIAPGGVTVEYAEQLTTLSLICLRRLRFPITGKSENGAVNVAARTVLAALGICATTLAFENGLGLRSRCLLWPDGEMTWELLEKPGQTPRLFTLDGEGAKQLLAQAVTAAKNAGLPWQEEPVVLKPSDNLVELVRKSQEQAKSESDENPGG
jgi:CRISPR-associated protein Csb1